MFSLLQAYATNSDSEEEHNDSTSETETSVIPKPKENTAASTTHPRPPEHQDDTTENKDIEDEDIYSDKPSSLSTSTNPYAVFGQEEADDSDSDEEEDGPDLELQHNRKLNEVVLNNPFRVFGTTTAEVKKDESVFHLEFLEFEQQKSEALQKHVKMTSTTSHTSEKINGKKVCWNFRKGKCRFGHNCTYGHDSDLLATKKASGYNVSTSAEPVNHNANQVFSVQQKPKLTEEFDLSTFISSVKKKQKKKSSDEEDDFEESKDNRRGKKSKKRPGLTQNLVPGKKIMTTYFKNKNP